MKRLLALTLLLPSLAYAQVWLVSPPCATGTPLPSECRWTIAGTPLVQPPYTDAAGKVRCATDLAGKTGSVSWSLLPANAYGPATTAATGTADMTQAGPPAAFPSSGFTLSPTKP